MNTQLLVERLTKRMDLHRIFLFSFPFLEEEQLQLLLVINPVKGLSPKSMAPIVSLCMSDFGEIPFDMIAVGEWQNQLKQGSLYYTYASLPQHLLFAQSKKKSSYLTNKTIGGLLELAQLNYDRCRKSSDEFREAVNNYITKNDYGQATFMLHQFLTVRLKGFQATVGINGGKSQNVEHLMKSIRGVAPQLQSIFPYDSPAVELLRLLDQSYTKGKKMEAVEITEEEFNMLLEKCTWACAAIDDMVAIMVERITTYQEQLPDMVDTNDNVGESRRASQAIANKKPSLQVVCEDFSKFPWPEQYKQDANTLLDGIYQKHRSEQVIMLNYHTGGFSGSNLFQQTDEDNTFDSKAELYLIVLMKNVGPYRFKCCKQGTASAMVVYLHVNEVERKLAEGDRFVYTWWTKGWVLRKKSSFSPSFTVAEVDWEGEYERVKTIWENAKACMGSLNEVIQSSAALKLDAGLLLLRDFLEMGVHTYLKCAVGYLPKQANLGELIDWCGITGRKLLDFTYPKSVAERARIHLMLRPERIWWEGASIGLAKVSQNFYRDQAKDLLRFFERLFAEVLAELEVKAGKSKEAEQPV